MQLRAFRQGDVPIVQLQALPENLKPSTKSKVLVSGMKKTVLSYGETGHPHVLSGNYTVLENETGSMFLNVAERSFLIHERGNNMQHRQQTIDPGLYSVDIQREYEPEGWRQVKD